MKILALDIETTPNLAWVWSLWKENIPLARLIENGEMLCWAAQWVGEKEVHFRTRRDGDHLSALWDLLDEADVVLTYNGKHFDVPHINRELLLADFTPPSPYRHIDLYETISRVFKFPSNKLQHVLEQLGFQGKVATTFDLWVDCMADDAKAWKLMKKYNVRDVTEMVRLYHQLLPWIQGHPNAGLDNPGVRVCTACGSNNLHRRGVSSTTVGTYQRYHCQDCGKYSRGRSSLNTAALVPAVS